MSISAKTWRVLISQYTQKPGKVHGISEADPAKSLCGRFLASEDPHVGLMPGEYTTDPITCGACLKRSIAIASEDPPWDLLLVARDIGTRWAKSLLERKISYTPWNPDKANAIALAKVAALHPESPMRAKLADQCLLSMLQAWRAGS